MSLLKSDNDALQKRVEAMADAVDEARRRLELLQYKALLEQSARNLAARIRAAESGERAAKAKKARSGGWREYFDMFEENE